MEQELAAFCGLKPKRPPAKVREARPPLALVHRIEAPRAPKRAEQPPATRKRARRA